MENDVEIFEMEENLDFEQIPKDLKRYAAWKQHKKSSVIPIMYREKHPTDIELNFNT